MVKKETIKSTTRQFPYALTEEDLTLHWNFGLLTNGRPYVAYIEGADAFLCAAEAPSPAFSPENDVWLLTDNKGQPFRCDKDNDLIMNSAVHRMAECALSMLPAHPSNFHYLYLSQLWLASKNPPTWEDYVKEHEAVSPDLYPGFPPQDKEEDITPDPELDISRDPVRTQRRLQALATNLKRIRTERSTSQEDMAMRAGITQAQMSRLENGKWDLNLSTLMDIAQLLGVTAGSLLYENVPHEGNYVWIRTGNKDSKYYSRYIIIGSENDDSPHRILFVCPVSLHETIFFREDKPHKSIDIKKNMSDIIAVSLNDLEKSEYPDEYIVRVKTEN